jgi:hypothetical protein
MALKITLISSLPYYITFYGANVKMLKAEVQMAEEKKAEKNMAGNHKFGQNFYKYPKSLNS